MPHGEEGQGSVTDAQSGDRCAPWKGQGIGEEVQTPAVVPSPLIPLKATLYFAGVLLWWKFGGPERSRSNSCCGVDPGWCVPIFSLGFARWDLASVTW